MATERDDYVLRAQSSGIDKVLSQLDGLTRRMGELARASEGMASKDLLPGLDVRRLQAASALLNQLQVQARASREIGTKGGFTNDLQRDQALTAAAARSARALQAVETEAGKERVAREKEIARQAVAANKVEWDREREQRKAVLAEMRADARAAWGEIAAGEKAQNEQAAASNKAIWDRERAQRSAVLKAMREDAVAAWAELGQREKELSAQAASANKAELEREVGQRRAILREMRADAVAAFSSLTKAEEAQHAQAARANKQIWDQEERQRRSQLQRMREDAQAAFGARPGSALFGQQNALPQDRINQLLAPGYAPVNSSSLGRVSRRQSALQTQMELVDAAILKAQTEARSGAVSAADSERRLATLAQRRASVAQQLLQAQELVRTALKEEASAQQAAAAASRQSAFGSAKNNFMIGFRGGQDVPYFQQIGQAFKFSLFYGTAYKALFALTQTFQAAVQEGIDFEQNLSDLAIASGKPKDSLRDLAENLAATAAATGASPSQGVQVGARALGLYGATNAPLDQQRFVATLSNDVVSKLAASSKLNPVDLQQSIAAITQALGVGAAGQLNVADLDAYFTKKYGIAQGSTFDAMAQSASVGLQAGFTPEQLFAISADLQSRTGATSTAVGGYLAQIFSRGGEGSLVSVAKQFGVDASQPLAEVVKQLAAVYNKGTAQQQAAVAAAFGRGKVQNAAVALLNDFGDIQTQAGKAQGGAASGALDRAFTQRMNNIGGELQQLTGSFKEFAHLFGESGLLFVLGAGIEGLKEFVDILNDVLRLYNELPAALRDIIALGATAAVAQKFGIGSSIVSGLAARGAAKQGPAMFLGRYLSATGAGAGIAEGSAVAGSTAALAKAGLGASLLAAAPWAAAVGGIVAIAQLHSDAEKMHQAVLQTNAVIQQAPKVGSSPAQYSSYANLLRETARNDRGATGTFTQIVTFGQADDKLQARANQLDAEARRIERVAADVRASQIRSTSTTPQNLFGRFSTDDITKGLDQITAEGGTAAQQLHHLRAAINGLGEAAQKQATRIDTGALGADLAGAAGGAKGEIFHLVANYGQIFQDNKNVSQFQGQIQQQLTGRVLQQRLQNQLSSLGVTSFSELTPQMINQITQQVGQLDKSQMDLPYDNFFRPIQQAVFDSIKKRLKALVGDVDKQLSGKSILTGAQATALANQILQTGDARQGMLADHDFTSRIQSAKKDLAAVVRLYNRADDATPQLVYDVQQAKQKVAAIQIEQLEALRSVAVQNAKNQKDATAKGMAFVRREVQIAVQSGDADLLSQVIAAAGKAGIAIAQNAINQAKEAADEAMRMSRAIQAFYKTQIAALKASVSRTTGEGVELLHGGSYTSPNAKQPIKASKGPNLSQIDALQQALNTTPSDLNADQLPKAKKAAEKEAKDSAAQINAARVAALAARRGGDIAAARAAIVAAQADMKDAKKGTVEYYNALASYYQARDQLNSALLSYRSTFRKLHSDITDPVVQARLAVKDALAQLKKDAGKGKDVRAADKLNLKQARADLQDQAFQQRLSDIQTQEQLGQISYAKYMSYLQHEHNRLEMVKHRTRQQQDELNQIDQLMKDAAQQMQGQWNFGDIKLPTPYQIRSYIEQQGGARAARLAANGPLPQPTVTITVNGADTAKVERIIDKYVGKPTRVLAPTNRRY